jgi:hypothetical protein
MTAITTRASGTTGVNGVTRKDAPLTNVEIDTNFINLNDNKVETADAVSTNTINKVVKRDGSGNFAANTITAALSGNASTATTLQTARNINNVSFNGSADINVPTLFDADWQRIVNPVGGRYTSTSTTVTGAITVTLPVAATSTMLQVTIKVYEYSTNKAFEIHAGGYPTTGNTWVNNPYAYIVGNAGIDRRFNVRFGYTSGGKMVIYIGELTSTWAFPQVFVTEVLCGYGGQATTYTTGWNVTIQNSAFENVTATVSDSQVGWTAQALQTANNYQVNSLGIGTAASGTAGEIRATNAITSFYSDERLKENITPIVNALEKVASIRGVTYNANQLAETFGFTDKSKQVGVLAGEVEKVLPEAVKPAPFDIMLFENKEMSRSGQHFKTVQYEKIVPLLIQAINELHEEVKSLKESK